jgi:hypothetical protein
VPEAPPDRYQWSSLNRLQLGKYAEYLAKMEFVLLGCDVFTSEVDDHGIDFVVRTREGKHYDVQVKSYRPGTSYVYLDPLHQTLLLALVRFIDKEPPTLFLIQSAGGDEPNAMFKKCFYTHKGARLWEWGLPLNRKTLAVLAADYGFRTVVARLALLKVEPES